MAHTRWIRNRGVLVFENAIYLVQEVYGCALFVSEFFRVYFSGRHFDILAFTVSENFWLD